MLYEEIQNSKIELQQERQDRKADHTALLQANQDIIVILNRFTAAKLSTGDDAKTKLPGLKNFHEIKQFEMRFTQDECFKNAFMSINLIF